MTARAQLWVPLITRICISLLTRTFFQPDEYFQALEPAHHAVFGYGYLTWEWLSPLPVRSFFFPSLFVPLFYVLRLFSLDSTNALIWAPKLLTAVFASITDYSAFRVATSLFGHRYGVVALFLSLTSPFNVLALSRSFSNSAETALTTLALSFFPWEHTSRRTLRTSLAIAAVGCAIRPTNAIIWATLIILYYLDGRETFISIISTVLPIAMPTLVAQGLLDSIYFGRPTFTAFNFLQINLSPVSLFYGQNPWHYYLSQALPILCATTLPLTVISGFNSLRGTYGSSAKKLVTIVMVTLLVYSTAGHKEWRFIHPLLPILHVLTSKAIVDSFMARGGPEKKTSVQSRSGSHEGNPKKPLLAIRTMHLSLVLASLPVSIYVMRYHGRGQIAVMHRLREIPPREVHSIGFLMPCHSTPWQAYLHKPELDTCRLWALGCEPPLRGEDLNTYKDQAAYFYDNPTGYLQAFFPAHVNPTFPPSPRPFTPPSESLSSSAPKTWQHEWPSHLVMFDNLLTSPSSAESLKDANSRRPVRDFISQLGYQEVWSSGWNGWEGDNKRRGPVKLWQFMPNSTSS